MSALTGVDAVILAGGKGTRLRSVVADRPKVLAEVAGRRVALLVASILLGINAFQAVAALAWRLGATVAPGGDLLGLTQYVGEAAALAIALLVLRLVPSIMGDSDTG